MTIAMHASSAGVQPVQVSRRQIAYSWLTNP